VRFGSAKRVASAVGEEAMAVQFVHEVSEGRVNSGRSPEDRILSARRRARIRDRGRLSVA